MLKFAGGALLAGIVVAGLIAAAGGLHWDNRLLWLPAVLWSLAAMTGFGGAIDADEHRGALLFVGVAALGALLAYAVACFFLLGLVGH